MLRMIRSARSRLHRDSGSEDGGSSGAGQGSATGSASTAASAARWRSDLKPGTMTRGVTPQETVGARSSRLSQPGTRSAVDRIAGSENAAPEKPQVPMAPAAVLGDATNTYCAGYVLGQRPPSGQDVCPPKPSTSEQRVVPNNPTPPSTSDCEMDRFALDVGNPQHVAEYAQDIFKVMKREEPVLLPSSTYMERQVYVNAKMRAILVDWLVDVHKKYKLRPETLFLAVHLLDRFLGVQVTAQRHLQLVGVSCLFISAKFEEVYPPQIKDFVYVTDKAYSKEEILKMECCVLKALEFKICRPTPMSFLERYQSVNGCTDAHRDLAQYLLELTLVDIKMLKYAPSHLAAASILLSNKLLRRPSWTPAAVRHTQMTEATLKDCAKEMCVLLECAEFNPLQAVRKKFSHAKHHSVAKLNFIAGIAPQASTNATVSSARERRVSTANVVSQRRSTGGAMDIS